MAINFRLDALTLTLIKKLYTNCYSNFLALEITSVWIPHFF